MCCSALRLALSWSILSFPLSPSPPQRQPADESPRNRGPASAKRHTFIASTRGPIHPEAQRLLYFIAEATTLQHMHCYTTDLKYETVMARNIQRVNAVASAAIGPGIAVRARGLARGRIGQDPPRHGWRMQDEIVVAMDGPINYAHLMSSEAFGAPN
jgi:hypothetical protein